jgi:hypothetical protein
MSEMARKVWEEPKLTVHGDVVNITQQVNKVYGASDGYTFQGITIRNAS